MLGRGEECEHMWRPMTSDKLKSLCVTRFTPLKFSTLIYLNISLIYLNVI